MRIECMPRGTCRCISYLDIRKRWRRKITGTADCSIMCLMFLVLVLNPMKCKTAKVLTANSVTPSFLSELLVSPMAKLLFAVFMQDSFAVLNLRFAVEKFLLVPLTSAAMGRGEKRFQRMRSLATGRATELISSSRTFRSKNFLNVCLNSRFRTFQECQNPSSNLLQRIFLQQRVCTYEQLVPHLPRQFLQPI